MELRLALVAVLLLSGGCGDPATPSRPNLVLIVGDDLAYRDLGFMGSEFVMTPRLDRLASEGAVFPVAYNTASVCRPSLRTLLTGLHPVQWDARVAALRARRRVSPGREMTHMTTMPGLLARNGYATFQAGKLWESHFEVAGFEDGTAVRPQTTGRAAAVAIGRSTMEPVWRFLDERDGRPFFLWFAPTLPHTPFDAADAHRAPYAAMELTDAARAYFANVTRFDAVVGALLDGLEERGLGEDTLVVYLNDNGWDQAPDFEAPLERGGGGLDGPRGKGSLYEIGFRTPLVLRWPGRIEPAVVRPDLVSTVDVTATLLDAAGVAPPPGREGRSLLPLLDGRGGTGRDAIFGSVTASHLKGRRRRADLSATALIARSE